MVGSITGYITEAGAAVKLSYEASEVMLELKNALSKKLSKKGPAVTWSYVEDGAELTVRIVSIDQGNQFLRWLLPILAPATLEVEGRIQIAGGVVQEFHQKDPRRSHGRHPDFCEADDLRWRGHPGARNHY